MRGEYGYGVRRATAGEWTRIATATIVVVATIAAGCGPMVVLQARAAIVREQDQSMSLRSSVAEVGISGCPTSLARVAHSISDAFGYSYALGMGPIYPLDFKAHGVLPLTDATRQDGWYNHKTLWMVDPRYRGVFDIRGRRLDGSGALAFTRDMVPLTALHITPFNLAREPGGWYAFTSGTRLHGPGCYVYEIDGPRVHETLVFRAIP